MQAVSRIGSLSSSTIDFAHQIGERHFGRRNEPKPIRRIAQDFGLEAIGIGLVIALRRSGLFRREKLVAVLLHEAIDKVVIGNFVDRLKLIFRELGQLRRAEHHLIAHQKRRADLRIAVLVARMRVEK